MSRQSLLKTRTRTSHCSCAQNLWSEDKDKDLEFKDKDLWSEDKDKDLWSEDKDKD